MSDNTARYYRTADEQTRAGLFIAAARELLLRGHDGLLEEPAHVLAVRAAVLLGYCDEDGPAHFLALTAGEISDVLANAGY